jgi:hypothetical protein
VLQQISHTGGVKDAAEGLFTTRLDDKFPELATSGDRLLPTGSDTTHGLPALSDAMAAGTSGQALDANIPSFFTDSGQFNDHDLTARTDGDTEARRLPWRT